jgi:hypothetical protein
MKFDIRRCTLADVDALCAAHHAYGGAGASATYAFGVYEEDRLVAAYAWQPPPAGAARAVNPHLPHGVLALSRMVAVPREERALKHISKPLLWQMKKGICRTRWPSLVTYSDEGLGHTGHVYRCSGWTPTVRSRRPQFEDAEGRRSSTYSNGKHTREGLTSIGYATIQRWEHHLVPVEESPEVFAAAGWRLVPIPGKVWRSGRQAHTVVRLPRRLWTR